MELFDSISRCAVDYRLGSEIEAENDLPVITLGATEVVDHIALPGNYIAIRGNQFRATAQKTRRVPGRPHDRLSLPVVHPREYQRIPVSLDANREH